MAQFSSSLCIKLLLVLLAIIKGVEGCYNSVFSFGDSIVDTGNIFYPHGCLSPPYGETYFHQPTGRCSDGRLIIDFIAESLGLPLMVQPYFLIKSGGVTNLQNGVNFAVAGATALDVSFFEERGIHTVSTNYSLRFQLDWFKEILPSLCNTSSKCNEILGRSLFLMGAIGGNDFNYPLSLRRSIQEIRTYVPLVIKAIASAIHELIEVGVVTLMVPGTLPTGCSSSMLTLYETTEKEEYDPETGCLNWLNKFAEYYNEQLQIELSRIQALNPHTNIIYSDYYNAAMPLYRFPIQFGFIGGALTVCCGGGGPYNYNTSVACDSALARVCDDPSQYVGWDGLHLTEAAYRLITIALLEKENVTAGSSNYYTSK